MDIGTYVILFGIIVAVGQLFSRSTVPVSLLLVVTGMLLSFVPAMPHIQINPGLVLHLFLPILVYQISSFSSWKDVKKNSRPIALLSVGHVIFITVLVAVIVHHFIPEIGWPLAFVLGAVISPPDDVAIVSIAEKVRLPAKIVTILEGEGLLNDATALILFRFSLMALITHQFFISDAIATFFLVVIAETLYGLLIGYIAGELRLRIHNPILHLIASFLTPFAAYLPAEYFGGCGVLAVVVSGFVIGNRYSNRFTPEFRLVSRAVWPALTFAIQSILFLLVGLEMHAVFENISSISGHLLLIYSVSVILTVIIGRFIWVYIFVSFLPRFLFPSIGKKSHYPRWQYSFILSWAGMRGAISLAAALAVPSLPPLASGANPKDLLVFLVFWVIAATLILQGMTLPLVLKILGLNKRGQRERSNERLSELTARLKMTQAVLRWLAKHKEEVRDIPKELEAVKLAIRQYRMTASNLKEKISGHDEHGFRGEKPDVSTEAYLLSQIIEIERAELLNLWRQEKINLAVNNKLVERLDHRSRHLPG